MAIVSIGHVGNFAALAIEKLEEKGHSIAHYDMRFVKPLDEELLHEIFKKFNKVITIEDGTITGGFGSALLEFASANNYKVQLTRLGVPDKFIEQGTLKELYNECGFHTEGIIKTAGEILANTQVKQNS